MPRVSFRTLTLMVLLLVAVLTHQYVQWVPTTHAETLWLGGDDPNDPNAPGPEISSAAIGQSFLDDDPNEPSEPEPEMAAVWAPDPSLVRDDPNEPSEPGPEAA